MGYELSFTNASYAARSISLSSSAALAILILKNQARPSASSLTRAALPARSALASITSPATGEYTSLAALTLSTTATGSPCAALRPSSGTSTNTMSPSWDCAWSVMPTVPTPSSTRIHSWSLVKRSVAMDNPRSCSALSDVAMRDEWQRHDRGAQRLAAHHQVHRRAGLGAPGRYVAHGDGAVDRRPEAA